MTHMQPLYCTCSVILLRVTITKINVKINMQNQYAKSNMLFQCMIVSIKAVYHCILPCSSSWKSGPISSEEERVAPPLTQEVISQNVPLAVKRRWIWTQFLRLPTLSLSPRSPPQSAESSRNFSSVESMTSRDNPAPFTVNKVDVQAYSYLKMYIAASD